MRSPSARQTVSTGQRMPPLLRFLLPVTLGLVLVWACTGDATVNRKKLYTAVRKPFVTAEEHALSNQEIALQDTSHPLAFRQLLESQHAGFSYQLGSSPTFTFDNIYVLSLATEKARQDALYKVARAVGMRYELFTATSKDEALVSWIADRVKEIRDIKRDLLAKAERKDKKLIGGMGIDSPWFLDRESAPTVFPSDPPVGDDRWRHQGKSVRWTDYLNSASEQIQSETTTLSVAERLWDPVEPEKFRQLNEAIIASWYSHTQMWRRMLERNERTALFMEDDIDIEWDFEKLWANIERRLPADWEMIHLGHCWGNTRSKPMYLNPILRISAEPRCLHAYALSQAGAKRLLELVDDPWTAYQSAIDLLIARRIREERVKAFVTEPPLIIQSKRFDSALQPGKGNAWRGLLMDSTIDRIMRSEGMPAENLTWENTQHDPCIWHS